jgi:AAA domain
MKLIFIYGLPAVGKLTVARELAIISGYRLFHNHLAVDLLLSVFEFGSAPFVELREQIWLSVFEEACDAQLPGLIFTFAPENTVRPTFIQQAIDTVKREGGEISFIELVCPSHELAKRIDTPSRREFQKLTSIELFEQLNSAGCFDSSYMPKAALSLDTSVFTPLETATKIAEALRIGKPQ